MYVWGAVLTPGVRVDVLLAAVEDAHVELWKDEAVVPGVPGEQDVGGVGHTRDGDAAPLPGERAQRLGDLLNPHAPVGRGQCRAAQGQRHHRLGKGQPRGAYPLQDRHADPRAVQSFGWLIVFVYLFCISLRLSNVTVPS